MFPIDDQPVKRAPVVYGRRPPPPSTVVPSEHDAHHATVPSQRRQSSPSPSVHASDTERSRSPNAPDTFQFGFKHRLKELDEQFGDRSATPGPSQVKDLQSVSMGTATLSSEARRRSGDLSRLASSASPTFLHATSAQEESPVVRRRIRRAQNLVPFDSEAEEPSNSSSVSPVRHAITTPLSRSSPTPPTSGDIPMVGRKTKGKAPARDVLPLIFDGEQPSAAELPTKSKKGKRRSEPLARPKTKVPVLDRVHF